MSQGDRIQILLCHSLFCGLGKPSEVRLTLLNSTWVRVKALVSAGCLGSFSCNRERRALLEDISCHAGEHGAGDRRALSSSSWPRSCLCLKLPCSSAALLPSWPRSSSFPPRQCSAGPAAVRIEQEKWVNTNLAKNGSF